MAFQPEQVVWFVALGILLGLAYFVPYKGAKIAIMVLVIAAFFINPFRMTVSTPSQSFERTPRITELPPKVEVKGYQPFDDWSQSKKDKLKQENEDNIHEIHN